jgi:hypothetical protein
LLPVVNLLDLIFFNIFGKRKSLFKRRLKSEAFSVVSEGTVPVKGGRYDDHRLLFSERAKFGMKSGANAP